MADESIELYFNARCSKARAARDLLEGRGVPFRLVTYLDEPPTRTELEALMTKLGIADPRAMMRRKETPYTELGLADADRGALLDAITSHPVLLERPIVVRGSRAVIARPPEKLTELFES